MEAAFDFQRFNHPPKNNFFLDKTFVAKIWEKMAKKSRILILSIWTNIQVYVQENFENFPAIAAKEKHGKNCQGKKT